MLIELILVGGAVFSGLDALEKRGLLARRRRKKPPPSAPPAVVEQSAEELAQGEADVRLRVATSSLSLALAATLINPWLFVPSMAGLLVVTAGLFRQSYRALRNQGKVHVYSLVSISVTGCILGGFYLLGSTAGFFYALSQKLLLKTRQRSRESLTATFQRQQPRNAWVLVRGVERETPVEKLVAGDIVVVNGGEVIPVDGTVVEGIASVDEQILTGESLPVEKRADRSVYASTLVLNGRILVRVERAGADTVVGEIGRVMQRTLDHKVAAQNRAERLAERTALPTLATGILSLPLLGPMGALAMINTHVGYRMSTLGSLNTLNYFQIFSRQGILVRDGEALEWLSRVDTVIFDKTGVLTQDQPRVVAIHPCPGFAEGTILRHAAAAEQKQSHPLARAIVEAAAVLNLPPLEIQQSEYRVGLGVSVTLDAGLLRVGSERFLKQSGIQVPASIARRQAAAHDRGYSLVMVALDEQLMGAIELQPSPRPEVARVVAALRGRGLRLRVLSGDHQGPTARLAGTLGISHYHAGATPQEKARIVRRLREAGRVVCYVGDGINDALALQEAQVSVSLGGASQVATDTASMVLMDASLNALPRLFEIGKDFEQTQSSSFGMIIVPSVVGATGVLLFQFGLAETLLLKQLGLGAGLTRVMTPLLRQDREPRVDRPGVTPPMIVHDGQGKALPVSARPALLPQEKH